MTVNFPLFPDDMIFSPDNRNLMSDDQIFTNSPDKFEEASFVHTGGLGVNRTGGQSKNRPGYPDLQASPSKLQNQRTTYSSVKRALGSQVQEVNTFERSHRRTAVEESKERAKRAAVKPRRPKGYVYPTDRVRPTLHSKIEEAPKINEERFREYQQRKEMNASSKSKFDRIEGRLTERRNSSQGDLFSNSTSDYFKQKRNSTYDR